MIDIKSGDVIRVKWDFPTELELYCLVTYIGYKSDTSIIVVPLHTISKDLYGIRIGVEQTINTQWIEAEIVSRTE